MNKGKKIAINSIIMYMRMIIMMLTTFYISRLALNLLGEEVYGLFSIITGVVLLSGFITTILESTAQRFIARSLALDDDVQSTISTFIYLNIFTAIVISAIVYISGYVYIEKKLVQSVISNDVVHEILIYSLVTFMLNLLFSPIMSIFIANEKVGYYSLFSFLEIFLKLTLLEFFIVENEVQVIYYSQVILFSVLISKVVAFITAKRIFIEIRFIPRLDLHKMREIISYISWNIFGTLAAIANSQGVNVLINAFFSLTISASRAIALQLNSAIIQVINSVQLAINPQIFKSYAKQDYKYLNALIDINGRVVMYLVTVVIIVCFGSVDKLLTLWLGSYPDYLVEFVNLMLLDVFIISQTSALVSVVQASGKIKLYQIVVGGTMLLNIPICYYFLSIGNSPLTLYLVPIAISTVCMIQRFVFVKKLNSISVKNYLISVAARGIVIMIALLFLKWEYLQHYPNYSLFVDVLVSGFLTTLIWIIFGIRKNERIIMFNFIKAKRESLQQPNLSKSR